MNRVTVLVRFFCVSCLLVLAFVGAHVGLAADVLVSPTSTPTPYAPDMPLRFDYLNIEHGLSQSVVNAIYQDSQGYLWFGTQDGLNRYDGYHFTIFRPDADDPSSLTDHNILSLAGDGKGNLWIGTLLGGLNYYDHQTGRFMHYQKNSTDANSLGGNCVRSLYLASSELLWIGSDGGVDVLDLQRKTFVARYRYDPDDPTGLLSNNVTSIVEDGMGMIWIGTDKGLDRLDPTDGAFTHFVHDPENPVNLIGINVSDILLGKDGNLWVATEFGVERLNPRSLTFKHFRMDPDSHGGLSHLEIQALLEDSVGNFWVGTGDGLYLFDRRTSRFTRYHHISDDPDSLNNAFIWSLYEDREGILWIGTFGGGVNKLDRGRNKFPLLQYDKDDPKNISSFGVIEDNAGHLWFAQFGLGLLHLDRSSGKYILYQHNLTNPENSLLNNYIMTVCESRDGTIWVGGLGGLNALDPQSGKFTHYTLNRKNYGDPENLGGHSAEFIFEDSQGFLWVAVSGGLDRLDRSDNTFTHYQHNPEDPTGLSAPDIATVFESRAGDIWLGYYEGGLSRLEQTNGKFTHYRHDPENPNSINSNAVHMILEADDGILWLATGYGLDKFDPQTETFVHYTTKNGLPNDVIYTLLEDNDGYYWLSTNFGLARFDPRTGKSKNYDFYDGLQSNEFNIYAAAKTHAGELIFSGISGANIFRPENLQYNEYVPPLVITNLTQGGEPLVIGQPFDTLSRINLRWPQNYFEFEFAALSYSEPEQNRYAYRLEDFDDDWVESGSFHVGRYTNLPSGSYTLHIKGSNNDGVWNETGTTIKVTVIPPSWQTWWFRSGLVLLVVAAILVGYRLRVRDIQARNRHLEQQVDARAREIEALFEQTKELAIVEERNRLARDLHDSAKQKAFAALAQLGVVRRLIQRDPNSAQKHLEEVETLVYEVIQELSFLIQEMYPLALEEKGLVTILREYIYEWENRNDIHILLKVQHHRKLPLQIEQALYRIVQESLANIARHSQANEVTICLDYHEETVELAVDDNGRGFDVEQGSCGMGLHSMRERAAMIGGQMAIESAPGDGTHIQVSTPTAIESLTANGRNGVHNV